MRGNNMNTNSLACKRRAQKAYKEKMVKFWDQKCSVYRCTFVMQPRQHQSSAAEMSQHTKCTRKNKRKGRERERKEEKMLDQIAKKPRNKTKQYKKKEKKEQTNKKKTHLPAHTFSHCDPCAMTFRECKSLTVL